MENQLFELKLYCIDCRKQLTAQLIEQRKNKPFDHQCLTNLGAKRKAFQQVIDKINGMLNSNVKPTE